jgi:prepilin-type N-terminal cleavage/methylation domain-containing protein
MRRAHGFTLVELMVAMTIMVTVLAAVFTVFNPSQGAFQTQPEVADMQQRLRIGVDALYQTMLEAGAGTYSGTAVGALYNFFAPVMPYRIGRLNNDPAQGVFFRSNAITITHVPTTASQCTIRDQMPQPSSEVKVNAQPGCPANDELCGFEEGMRCIIFDDTGAYDFFTITAVQRASLHLQHNRDEFSKAYGPGAIIAQVWTDTYYLNANQLAGTYQLMHYDGDGTDAAVVDNLVELEFSYLGEAQPPVLRRPVTDPVGPWTTYGPKPPALGVNDASDSWPAGQNCMFTIDAGSGLQVARLPSLGPAGSLVSLTQADLTDGPWCPDATNKNRYDADLLRIREIAVRLRFQTGVTSLRGPVGPMFAVGGLGKAGDRFIPDQTVVFSVSPRNLNLGR